MAREGITRHLDLDAATDYATARYQADHKTTRALTRVPSLEGQQWSLVLNRQVEVTPGISVATFYAVVTKVREGYQLEIAG